MNQPAITYPVSEWENYARLHASVTTSFQLAVYKEACKYLIGDIIDCGCGTAKIAPLLVNNKQLKSYTGVDFAEEMVKVSRWILEKLGQKTFNVEHSKIEELKGKEGYFTSGVSIQSYYSWPDPLLVLRHINKMLTEDGVFVLATPNQSLSLERLAVEAEKELIAHPDFEVFKQYNLELAGNTQANFIEMDNLIRQVQQVGFQVLECHQRHFLGGLSFLVLKKNIS